MRDPWWMHVLLGIHVTAGGMAFVLAPLALVTAKGGKAHRRWGKLYFWAMTVVAATALAMAVYRPTLFLALVAVFSFYLSFSGYRVLAQKAAWKDERVAGLVDWGVAVFSFAASAGLAVCGAFRPELVQGLGIPAIIFGLIGMRFAGRTMWGFLHPPREKMFWWYAHLQGMIGSYIAAWTAFCVVTVGPLLHGAWWVWIVPIMIGVPAIIVTTAYYKRKFAVKAAAV
ncbi:MULTISPECIES: DUF2306 domain-containing protein [Acidobacterium]|uniref:Putative membrane protein n=1 Tax=Acidobacterium capsulatum (strain ATCC 51196 / DSM 11244 / BCRC 80197 / JCM 7670 / NBRC 15755 / NCIMB 13165 / 161) TaxID=240015 RepID=C1F845_ACIC5|nr:MULTISPECIES: DUF2306 domain-containing protein [Acidobacterium]ACO34470.1 putative membrane protein [Acidobacterium capsulatum ATCC 51196]HCT59732.1 hypothetical protein [Acidobacterium sp.]